MPFGELGSTAQEAEETVKEVSCASAMLTIMTRKMIRASRGTNPTPQRWHSSDNAYIMFCSEGHGDAQPLFARTRAIFRPIVRIYAGAITSLIKGLPGIFYVAGLSDYVRTLPSLARKHTMQHTSRWNSRSGVRRQA